MEWTTEFNSEILFTKLNFVSVVLRLPNLIGFCPVGSTSSFFAEHKISFHW